MRYVQAVTEQMAISFLTLEHDTTAIPFLPTEHCTKASTPFTYKTGLHNPPSVASLHRDLLLHDEESNLGLFSHAFAPKKVELTSPMSFGLTSHQGIKETRDDDTVTIMPLSLTDRGQELSTASASEADENGTCNSTCDSMNETPNKDETLEIIIGVDRATNHCQHLEIDLSQLEASHTKRSNIVSLYQCQVNPTNQEETMEKKLERVFCGELNLDQSHLSCLHHTRTKGTDVVDHYHPAHEYGYVLQVDGHDELIVVPYSTQ